jgi:AraC-like DNA-binding protein
MKATAAPATISMGYLAALLRAAGTSRADAIELFKQTGLALALLDEPTARITEHEFSVLYRRLAIQLDDEMLQLFSRAFRPGALKFTCMALLDAKNLMVVLHRWANVSRLLRDDFNIELQSDERSMRISLVNAQPCEPCQPMALDMMLKVIHGVGSWLIGQRIPLQRVDFPFPQPGFAADYEVLFPGPVFFNQPRATLHFDAELLQAPVRRSKHDLNEFLLRAPEDWIFVGLHEERLSQRMRGYLAERLPLPATAESAAEALHVSTRTLHRRLADEGTSFQRVKDEFRRDMAVQMLTKSHAPINTISAQLGFDSTASFHRAFRGWTGDTPGAFRGAGTPTR